MSNALAFLLLKCRIGLGAECNICSVLSIGVALFHYVRGTLRFPWQPAVLFSFLFARSLRYFFFFLFLCFREDEADAPPKTIRAVPLSRRKKRGRGGGTGNYASLPPTAISRFRNTVTISLCSPSSLRVFPFLIFQFPRF